MPDVMYLKGEFYFDQFAGLALEQEGAILPDSRKGGSVPVAAMEAAGLVYIRGNPGCPGAVRFAPGRRFINRQAGRWDRNGVFTPY